MLPLYTPVVSPPLAGVLKLPAPELLELELPLELDELPEPDELPELDPLLEPDPLLDPEELPEPDELPELDPLLGVQPEATPAGINKPLSIAMYTVQSGNVTFPFTREYVVPL